LASRLPVKPLKVKFVQVVQSLVWWGISKRICKGFSEQQGIPIFLLPPFSLWLNETVVCIVINVYLVPPFG
jgi:hypothetical protein